MLCTIDYRMGAEWGQWGHAQIDSLVLILREFTSKGGAIAVKWWGEDGNREFRPEKGNKGVRSALGGVVDRSIGRIGCVARG